MKVGGFSIILIIHALLALFLIIELGLLCYVVDVSWHWVWAGSPTEFLLFTTIWSILVLVYTGLIPRFVPKLHFPVVALGLLGLTMLFWFAGATALASRIGVPRCHGGSVCQSTQAAVAFGYFIWAGFLGLFGMDALAFFKSRGPAADADKA